MEMPVHSKRPCRKRVSKPRKRLHRKIKNIDSKFLKKMLDQKIGRLIRISLLNNKNPSSIKLFLGYSIIDLFNRLNKTMPSKYTWQDFVDGKLHIDHIIPRSVFNYSDMSHIDFRRCWSLNNLQLLPAKENLRKSDKIIAPFQPYLALSNRQSL